MTPSLRADDQGHPRRAHYELRNDRRTARPPIRSSASAPRGSGAPAARCRSSAASSRPTRRSCCSKPDRFFRRRAACTCTPTC